jgi:hypothetical protein
MKIAIDYDDTYTRDPLMWNWFVAQARERGHEVYCVTARSEQSLDEVRFTLGQHLEPGNVVGTNHKAKRKFMADRGIMIDVWIDDQPEMIVDTPLLRGL